MTLLANRELVALLSFVLCTLFLDLFALPLGVIGRLCPVSILYKSIAGRYRPVRVADGPIMARYRFIKNASWVFCDCGSAWTSTIPF